jgi:hypothetical protein
MATLLPQAARSGAVASPSAPIPAGAAFVVVSAIMDAPDVDTPGTTIGLALVWTLTGGQVQHGASCLWESGPPIRRGRTSRGAPAIRCAVPAAAIGVSGQLELPRAMNVGLAVELQDAQGDPLAVTPSATQPPLIDFLIHHKVDHGLGSRTKR